MVRAALPLLLLACAASAISFPATTIKEVSRTLKMVREVQKFTTMDEGPSEACAMALMEPMMAFIATPCVMMFGDNEDTEEDTEVDMQALCHCEEDLKIISDTLKEAVPTFREACGRCDEYMINMTSSILLAHESLSFTCQTNEGGQMCLEVIGSLQAPPPCETMEEVLGCCAGVAYFMDDCMGNDDGQDGMPDCPQVNKQACSASLDACPGEGMPSIFADCVDSGDSSAAHSSSSNVLLALSLIIAVMLGFKNV